MNILRYAFKNIFRNFFLSISSVLIITLLVFFVNILLLVVFASDKFIASINDRISLTINFQPGYDNTQIRSQEFLSGISKEFPGVDARYISRTDALTILSERNPDLASLVENIDDNPLPDSVRISNVPVRSYDSLNEFIANFQDILQYDKGSMDKKLLDYKTQYDQVSQIAKNLRALNTGVYILIGLFIFTVFAVVHMVIRNIIFFLQDEVRIIELVGGKPSFIYGPFILQGIVYVVLATICAFFIFYGISSFGVLSALSQGFQSVLEEFRQALLHVYFPLEMATAFGIGLLSALLASYKYIHSTIRE